MPIENKPVKEVNLERYAGKWYSLASIPTIIDRNWQETTEEYTINRKGYYNVLTTYKKKGKSKVHQLRSKVFQVRGTGNAEMKAQFVWLFKSHYWVIELADDYSYTVVGHPKLKYLFIMSRHPFMNADLYQAIVERCEKRGYAVHKLKWQGHSKKPV